MVKEWIPKKYNYGQALDSIHSLEESANKCSLRTPQLSSMSARFVEAAFCRDEIDTLDHSMLLDRVAMANDKFFKDCGHDISQKTAVTS
jgi:hypothetical protein